MKALSNWRSVRLWQTGVERDLRKRHWLRLHGMCIGLVVLGVMWATAHLQFLLDSQSLALRYLVTLGVGYAAYLLVLRGWAQMLVRREALGLDGVGDLPVPDVPASVDLPVFGSGGGGDFAGGGASADFSGVGDVGGAVGDVAGDVASGALEAAAGADEGALIVVPVVAIFLIGCALVFGAGSLMLLYFGWEALLTVAVELAFSYVTARTAVKVVREGWLLAAVRLTWKPLAGAVLCAVLLGGTIDYFLPQAHSLPEAMRMVWASL